MSPFDIGDITLPEYHGFIRDGHENTCLWIDANRIIAEILWGDNTAIDEVRLWEKAEKVLIEGKYSIVLRYKRESNDEAYPAVVLGFDISEENDVIIRHIQGVKQNRISYRFSSSFDTFGYFVKLIEENFTKKWIRVWLPAVPTNLDSASYGAQSPYKYEQLRKKLETLNASISEIK